MDSYEFERLFYTEVREKARTGRGVHNRASRKKGYKGGVRFPYDTMSRADKKKLIGVVVVSNIYDEIMPYEEFKGLEDDNRAVYLKKYIERHGVANIVEAWGGRRKAHLVYDNMRKYGIPSPTGRGGAKKNREKVTQRIKEVAIAMQEQEQEADVVDYKSLYENMVAQRDNILVELEAVRLVEAPKGIAFNLSLEGEMQGKDVYDRMVKLLDLIEPSSSYVVAFNLDEKEQRADA